MTDLLLPAKSVYPLEHNVQVWQSKPRRLLRNRRSTEIVDLVAKIVSPNSLKPFKLSRNSPFVIKLARRLVQYLVDMTAALI
jgi:hypothetical protein